MSNNSQNLSIYNLEFIDIQNEYLVDVSGNPTGNEFIIWNLSTTNGVNDTTVNEFPVNVNDSIYPDDLFSFSYSTFVPTSS
jgi:hypothetical protein